jgi:predicted DNA-binding transcriptional regulator YafY
MSYHSKIRRYSLIIEKIDRRHFPSLKELKSYLHNHGFEISGRTLQRDIEQLRDDFGIEIEHNRYKNGYFINEVKSLDIDAFLRFLSILNEAELLTETLRESKENISYLSFHQHGRLKGLGYLQPLLTSVKNNRKLKMTYESFHDEKNSSGILLCPYLLKEFNYRWYIIGKVEKYDDLRIFGLDRIVDLKMTDQTFPEPEQDIRALFESVVGLNFTANKKQEILLEFTSLQGRYIKALPIHPSQEVIKETESKTTIKLMVRPNFELKQKLLSYGDSVIVMKPKWLKEELISKLKSALNNYSD